MNRRFFPLIGDSNNDFSIIISYNIIGYIYNVVVKWNMADRLSRGRRVEEESVSVSDGVSGKERYSVDGGREENEKGKRRKAKVREESDSDSVSGGGREENSTRKRGCRQNCVRPLA
jgi:hypothetical protein